jgi:hypothetical protein
LVGIGLPAWIIVQNSRFAHRSHVDWARSHLLMAKETTIHVRHETGCFCLSASHPIPASVPHGTSVRVSESDWDGDAASGWKCLQGRMYQTDYQFSYVGTQDAFEITARGDLDGNGIESRFVIRGTADGDKVTVSPIEATNPDE